MQTLVELLPRIRELGKREALRYHNGYRTWRLSYAALYERIAAFARYLEARGFQKGDRLLLWGENSPEWVSVFWACLARGVEVVPVDYHSSPALAGRIQREVQARLLVAGEEVESGGLGIEVLTFSKVGALGGEGPPDPIDASGITAEDVVEIIYTSGTTGEPMGVVHRHKNICANLTGIGNEIERYRRLAGPFQPIRLLDMLPLSHMFGQSAGLFFPPLLGGAAVFARELNPGAIIETIRRERVSVLIAVPGLLANLRNEIARRLPAAVVAPRRRGLAGAAESWWRYRQAHHRLGWKFWALVVGGARLDADLEDFWRRLGFVLVQGYGLTETSPVVSLNHPFDTRRGSIGKALEGQEVKLAPDGEILVRGPSVVSEYLGGEPESRARFDDGWLHTGDIAEMDGEGRLYYRGRKKEMIVTPEGLNVYPQDVEAVLNRFPEVKESAVIAMGRHGEERVHAVLILREARGGGPAGDPAELVRRANHELESHQRIQGWSIWPEPSFPRTPSTMKIKRGEVARRVAAAKGAPPQAAAPPQEGVKGVLAQLTGRDAAGLRGELRLSEDLGLTSLERVELLARLEDQYRVELDEERFAAIMTVADLERHVSEVEEGAAPRRGMAAGAVPEAPRAEVPGGAPRAEPAAALAEEAIVREVEKAPEPGPEAVAPRYAVLPRWSRWRPVRWMRALLLQFAILPMVRELVRLKVEGRENLKGLKPPVIFVANHVSHFDTPVIYCALPWRLRYRLAPAMSQDFFRAYFEPRRFSAEQRLKAAGQYYLACSLFNAYPLPQRMGGTRRALQYTGELIDRGYCPLVFPEGERSPTGEMLPFKTGIGLMAQRLRVAVVPIYVQGMYEVYSVHQEWPQPGRVRVTFGRPMEFDPREDYEAVTSAIEQAVRELKEHAQPETIGATKL